MVHYSDKQGHDSISSQVVWTFKAHKPPGSHAKGVYFTTLRPDAVNLAVRLMIPRRKLEFVFSFNGDLGLAPLAGGRGKHIFWTPQDYSVADDRQVYHGKSEEMP